MPLALATAFLAEATGSAPTPDGELVEARLRELVAQAREQWPGIAVGDACFAARLGGSVAGSRDPLGALAELCIDDLLLAVGCAEGDAAALAAIDGVIDEAAATAVRQLDSSPTFAAEIAQMTRVKLLVGDGTRPRRIGTYRGRGKLRSWLQVAALRTAIEQCRKRKPERSDDEIVEAAASSDDPELQQIRRMYRDDFAAAFRKALDALSSRERNVLRMYLLDGLNIDRIGAVYRVHRATVARWIAGARERLLDETRAELQRTMRLSTTEFESLLVCVRSHLDLSLERFLEPK
jgi:RNA polymerase sigma-70 factor (ECF subfamily)